MSGYTVVYFPLRGRAELVRLTLAAAGQEWNEQVLQLGGEDFAAFKTSDKCPFGQVPVLLDGDKVVGQSIAMARYVARKHDLLGDLDQGLVADMLVDHWSDILNQGIVPLCFGPGADADKLDTYAKETLPGKLVPFNNFLKSNEGKGFVAGDSFSFADVILFMVSEFLFDNGWATAESEPLLAAHKELVAKNEGIAKYLASEKRCGPQIFKNFIKK